MRKTAVVYSTAGAYSMPHLYIHQPTPIIIKRPDNVTWHRPNSRLRHTIIAASSALLQAIHTFVPDSNSNARYSHPAAANRALGFSASKELFHTEGMVLVPAAGLLFQNRNSILRLLPQSLFMGLGDSRGPRLVV